MRYFYHLAGAAGYQDETGVEFATLQEAKLQAVRFAGEFLKDCPEAGLQGRDFRLEVSDRQGFVWFTFLANGSDGPLGHA